MTCADHAVSSGPVSSEVGFVRGSLAGSGQGVTDSIPKKYTCTTTTRSGNQGRSKYTVYMYNDDPLRQPGPHTRSYTPK